MFPFTALNHPTSDLKHPTILLHTSSGDRFLFGKIPEGAQRSMTETKTKVSKVSGIFLTGELNWESIGGLPGLILTISDQGKKNMNLFYGNEYLNYIISTWRSFVFRFGMDINSVILPNRKVYKTDIMQVESVVLTRNENSSATVFDHGTVTKLKKIVSRMFPLTVKNTYTHDENKNFEKIGDPKLSDPYIHVDLPKFEPVQTSTCYVVQMNGVRGRFSAEKAESLGVPKGKIRGQLAQGKEIRLDNGSLVRPNQVLSESRQFENVIILDLPSVSYLNSAMEQNWGSQAGIVYHLLGEDVEPFSDEYLRFIRSFGDRCEHYISHPLYCPNSLVFKSSAFITLKLKALQPHHFNLPQSSKAIKVKPDFAPDTIKILNQGQISTIECSTPDARNSIALDQSNSKNIYYEDFERVYQEEVLPLNFDPSHPKEMVLAEAAVNSTNISNSEPLKNQVEIITLGTGSALPSKYRNVISNLVRLPFINKDGSQSIKSVLLDAGENTIGSMYRTLRKDNIPTFFQELKMIYLSHLHADHHLGIVTIIQEWIKYNQDNDEMLYLVAPWQYHTFVNEWFTFDNSLASMKRISFISCEEFLVGKKRYEISTIPFEKFMSDVIEIKEYKKPEDKAMIVKKLFSDLHITKFSTCRAIHCDWSYCCSITFNLSDSETFKLSYSGDTRPNYYMFAENIGQHSDLLIHEATLENDLLEEAKKKRHSTINEAIEVGNKMNAKKLLLTHFSQRYPKLPTISADLAINSRYCFAFDSMINKFGDIGDQENLIDQLNAAFLEEKNKIDAEIDED